VITATSAESAQALADKWKAGASWAAMQEAAKAAGATAVDLPVSTREQVPSPELADAAFAAQGDAVVGPIKAAFGSQILRVIDIVSAKNPSFDSLHQTLRDKVAADKALDLIDARAQKFQDLFAGGAKIDEVPGDLGATGAAGTLDAKGDTPQGEPAPIPAPADLRQQIIDTAFKTNPGDPIEPVEGPNHSYYAVAVDSITKPARLPFEQVRGRVLADWQADQVRHTQETEAARVLALVQGGQSLANAAWGRGLTISHTPPLARGRPQDGLSAELVTKLFGLKKGEGTMAATDKGFVVAQVADIIEPDAKDDQSGVSQAEGGLTRALHDDYLTIYAIALREAAKPQVRMNVVENLIQQGQ
jgi:peptidyl-prolyl cis-trans isomerase D